MPYPEVFPASFTPNLVIPVRHIDHLKGFEDNLAITIDPDYDTRQWVRAPLKQLLRPKGFEGDLANISFVVMDEPFERLLEAQRAAKTKPPTVRFNNGEGKIVSPRRNYLHDLAATYMTNFVGLTLVSEARSGSYNLGTVDMDIWYGAVIAAKRGREIVADEAILRIATFPRYDEELFKERTAAAKKRGHSVRQGVSGKSGKGGSRIDPSH